jgi:ketosteroid isomerase-like protein
MHPRPGSRERRRDIVGGFAVDENKQLLQRIFQEMSMGDSRPFVNALADDVTWKVMGRTQWSGTYRGKQTVLNDLLRQLQSRLADRYRASADRIIAEGPYVVVQARGQAMTTAGTPYNNEYCFIYRVENGLIKEVIEYLDTELVTAALR